MNRQEISVLLAGGPNDTYCHSRYRHIIGVNADDVLDKILRLRNCFCSWKNKIKIHLVILPNRSRSIFLFYSSCNVIPATCNCHLSQLSCQIHWQRLTSCGTYCVVQSFPSLQHHCSSLVERGASAFLKVLKVIPLECLNTLIPPKPNTFISQQIYSHFKYFPRNQDFAPIRLCPFLVKLHLYFDSVRTPSSNTVTLFSKFQNSVLTMALILHFTI